MPIKVFLVEDSPVAIAILTQLLTGVPDISIVGTAKNGLEALEQIPTVEPTVVCTDLLMGKMDGYTLIQQLMHCYPCPVLVISQAVQPHNTDAIAKALQAGAVDVFPKPPSGLRDAYAQSRDRLIQKIRVLAGVKVYKKHRTAFSVPATGTVPNPPIPRPAATGSLNIVTIGSSTGGPQALRTILKRLPHHFPLPIIITQHISKGFLQGMVDWLQRSTALKLKVAAQGESPSSGTVYFVPEDCHLGIGMNGTFKFLDMAPVNGHRPSITLTFQTIAHRYGAGTIGILLTGMGRDGAEGLLAIAQAGGMTIAQDEASSVIFGMPNEAIQLGAAQQVLGIQAIAPYLLDCVMEQR